jgi:hypothetical protein
MTDFGMLLLVSGIGFLLVRLKRFAKATIVTLHDCIWEPILIHFCQKEVRKSKNGVIWSRLRIGDQGE